MGWSMASCARALARHAFGVGMAIGLLINLSLIPALNSVSSARAQQAQGAAPPPDPGIDVWVATQLSVWLAVFGTQEEPNALYALDGPVAEAGDYMGTNRYGVPFILAVKLAGEGTAIPNDPRQPVFTFVVALMEGPAGDVPVVGSVISSNHPDTGERIHSLLVAEMMTDAVFAPIAFVSDHAIQGEPYRGAGQSQEACVGACNDAAADATLIAMAAAAAALAIASVALYALLSLCGAAALVPGVGIWATAICGLRAYYGYAVAVASIALALGVALAGISNDLVACLQGCGITIAFI